MPLAASVFTVISAESAQRDVGDGRPAQPTLSASRAACFISPEPPQGRGPRDNAEEAPPSPRPKPHLQRPRRQEGFSLAGGGGRFGPPARGRARGGGGGRRDCPGGPARDCYLPLSAPRQREGNRRRRGRGQGESGVIFHLSHLFRPARKSESRHRALFARCSASGWLCARLS